MLVIRLQRTGRKNLATYRLIVAEKARAAKGKFLEILGHYLPQQNPKVFKVEQDKVAAWIKKGAIPSDTVARLLMKDGMKGMDKYMKRYAKQKSKSAPAEEPAAPAAPKEENRSAGTPAAEAPAEAPAEAAPVA
jgi:small subunit ribosomal protein S16